MIPFSNFKNVRMYFKLYPERLDQVWFTVCNSISVNTSEIDEKYEKQTLQLQVLSISKTAMRNKNLKNNTNQ